jgi:hypothetical protein
LWTIICLISGSGLSPACCRPSCLSSLCLLKVPTEISSLLLPSSLVGLQHTAPSAACSFSILYYSGCFAGWGGLVCPGGYAGLTQGWLWEYHVMLICSPVGLLDISQAGLEPVSGGAGALLFSQSNVAWRGFVWAGVSGCRSFDSFW